ncbi:serine hydrolase BPHL [Dermatophagoides farinae]|uniref:Dienelactone hydrolase-like protein n=1 Tax=Dermatophagoides farinae TaxID=6954 RepID=A0A922IA19_DERFA|nr:valacyclovir hydrolase-like [Dermatophagoides farinae]KAH7636490.1 dienelactone hydrolase-like protein [Dermatophagoides farinae]KAH9527731.1 hypothetical protein DERF_001737 [Dermatophagoides farinae]
MNFIKIGEFNICFEKFGHGPIAVLVIPGAIGTAKSDFDIQFNPKHSGCLDFERFTFICVELPGWGRSIPPERPIGPNVLHDDADRCDELMKKLGYNEYSVYGWSEGSKVAIIMARKFGGSRIRSSIVQGLMTFHTDSASKNIMWSRDIQNWDIELLRKYEQAYGDDIDRVEDLWQRHIDLAIENYGRYYPQGLLGPVQDGLRKIQCPTLVLHGDRDFFIELKQAEHVAANVPNSRLIRFPNCGHNLHHVESIKFKQTVENFLLDNNN